MDERTQALLKEYDKLENANLPRLVKLALFEEITPDVVNNYLHVWERHQERVELHTLRTEREEQIQQLLKDFETLMNSRASKEVKFALIEQLMPLIEPFYISAGKSREELKKHRDAD